MKNQKKKFKVIYLNIFVSLLAFIILGCYATELVDITVRVDSKVDMKKYKTIAVIDFIDKKAKTNESDGKTIARMIRKQLKNSKEFQVIDEKSMELESTINEDDIKDTKFLVSLASQLGVDALIVGEFEFYQRYRSVPYIAERYSVRTGKYVPEGGSYVQRVFGFSIKARVVDGATGETVFNYAPRAEERPEYRNSISMPFSDGTNDPSNLRFVAIRPITNLVLSLIPHYEKERRFLVK